MPSLPCTKCRTLLQEPDYYRTTTAHVPNRDSVMQNVLWMCQSCHDAASPDERSLWLARHQVPAEGKGKWRSVLGSLLRRPPGK